MKSYPNIEKSKWRKGEYVGYCNGDLFFIRKAGTGGWQVQSRENPSWGFKAATLDKVSDVLVKRGKPAITGQMLNQGFTG